MISVHEKLKYVQVIFHSFIGPPVEPYLNSSGFDTSSLIYINTNIPLESDAVLGIETFTDKPRSHGNYLKHRVHSEMDHYDRLT